MRREGLTLTAIARALNEDNTPTATGRTGAWHPTTVRVVCRRQEGTTNE